VQQRQAEYAEKDAAKAARRLADDLIEAGMNHFLNEFNVFDNFNVPTATATL
jgi:hypothetical protein